MCGIVGFWSPGRQWPAERIAREMAHRTAHRGPDSSGEWADPEAGIALAHRRLSILDLTPAGHQPMVSQGGQYVLTYNGEIYNHLEIRAELDQSGNPPQWRGTSDTETLLAAIQVWGVPKALERLNGMFAFALWDRAERTVHLARDRMGEKPLFYGRQGRTFLFASELKALALHPDWEGRVSRDALALFLRHNDVPTPYCIYEGLRKLPPGHYVVVSEGGHSVSHPICYWSLEDAVRRGQTSPVEGTDAELTDRLEALLLDAVKIRMAADVPLGAFLSGGIDSTTVVSLMQAQSDRPVRTFSIGFDEAGFNEAVHAREVAAHLGTDHTELYVRPDDALAVIPSLPEIWDEPFADSSQIPTYLVSRLAREHVTVSLSGDGGDELFCGYNRYVHGYAIWRALRALPRSARTGISRLLAAMPPQAIDAVTGRMPKPIRYEHVGDRLLKLSELLDYKDDDAFYRMLISTFKHPAEIVPGATEPQTILTDKSRWPAVGDVRERMMYLDAASFLPDDILTKVDRATMAVSLEARVPLLDHRAVEFAFGLPLRMKLRRGQSKWLLRQVLYRHVPQRLMERPKMGFGMPIERWMNGPLRDWAEDLLDPRVLREGGFFDPEPIRRMWQQQKAGGRRWHYYLWHVLMFQAWLRHQDSVPAASSAGRVAQAAGA